MINILVYTTGGFCDVMACSALATNNDLGVISNISFLLNSVDKNERYEKQARKNLTKLLQCEELNLYNIYNYCDDQDINNIDGDKLKFDLPKIDKIYIFAESSGLRYDVFRALYPHSEIIVYEEGMLGYCADIFHNSELGGLAGVSKYYSTNYFSKLLPQSIRQVEFDIIPYDKELIQDFFSRVEVECDKETEEDFGNGVLFISAPLWRMGPLSHEEVLYAHLAAITDILSSGTKVLFKDHPRPDAKLFNRIRLCLEPELRALFIDVSNYAMLAEGIIDKYRPLAVVGFGSTALFNSYHFYNVPSFRVSTELVAYSLNSKRQHLLNCTLKCEYIPELNVLLEILSESFNDVKLEVTTAFQGFINSKPNSLDNELVNKVYNALFIENINVANEIPTIKDVLYKGDVKGKNSTFISYLYLKPTLRKLKVILESRTGLKIVEDRKLALLRLRLSNSEKTISKLLAYIEEIEK